ncbi:hypothetical protein KEM48_002875 [Puccinia striiformis f. sp. tritici PST-130]|nr:hypothetical protein KEM48_002875 [Puccinia striiformis f. sp. tritici PST-130]
MSLTYAKVSPIERRSSFLRPYKTIREKTPKLILAPFETLKQEFVTEFFDQNPISQLCILITKDAVAERLSGLSGILYSIS